MASVELNATYTITAPNGAVAVLNDQSSPDYVGVVTELGGFDSPDVRESAEDLVAQDGGIHGDFFDGRRPITINGVILNPSSATDRNVRLDKLSAAVTALRADSIIKWTPSGGEERYIAARLQNGPRFSGAWQKEFTVGMVAEDPRIYSTQLYQATISASSGGTSSGRVYDKAYNFGYGAGTPSGSTIIPNTGTITTYPTLIVYGPGTNPVITNFTTGQSISLTYTLGAGEFMQIETHPLLRTVMLNNQASRYSAVDFLNTSWWGLVPGNNDIRIAFATSTTGASLGVSWRNAWR